ACGRVRGLLGRLTAACGDSSRTGGAALRVAMAPCSGLPPGGLRRGAGGGGGAFGMAGRVGAGGKVRVMAEQTHDVYDLYSRGRELLERGDFAAAAVPLARARALEPDKASI